MSSPKRDAVGCLAPSMSWLIQGSSLASVCMLAAQSALTSPIAPVSLYESMMATCGPSDAALAAEPQRQGGDSLAAQPAATNPARRASLVQVEGSQPSMQDGLLEAAGGSVLCVLWLTQGSSLASVCGSDALWALFGIGRAGELLSACEPLTAAVCWLSASWAASSVAAWICAGRLTFLR